MTAARRAAVLAALVGGCVAVAVAMESAIERPAAARALDVRSLAAGCASCHGAAGPDTVLPSLAGRPADDLLQRLRAYRAADPAAQSAPGARLMQQLARGYSDAQLQALAQWFAAQR